jgi:4'-phosphopantetheinyl transferase
VTVAAVDVRPVLVADEVHVWSASLDGDSKAYWPSLAEDERAAALRFRFDVHRNRYIVGRGLLRRILGHYLGREPGELRFRYGRYGKPSLSGLAFNVSHADSLALYAVARDGEVGVDVERLQNKPAEEGVAERFFSPGEVETLRSLPREEQARAFLACWTRKEAFIKARGNGLSLALDSFDVTLGPDDTPALTRTAWSASEPRRWSLVDLSERFPGYVAALAVRRKQLRVLVQDWTGIEGSRDAEQ